MNTVVEKKVGKEHLYTLTAIRGLAFICVFLCHADVFGVFAILGAWGVEVFFVLSGFLMAYSYFGTNRIVKISLKQNAKFTYKKIMDLYPLYIILTGIEFIFIYFIHGDSFTRLSVVNIILNVLLLQTWVPIEGVFTINGPAWFLCTLILAYFLFPWILNMMENAYSRRKAIVMITAIFGMELIVGGALTGLACVIGRDLSSAIYQFPVFRFLDFFLGCNLFYIYKDHKIREENTYVLLEIFATIVVVITLVLGEWQILLGSIYIGEVEIDRWWVLTIMNVPSACLIIYLGALGKGKISHFLNKKKSVMYVSKISKYAFLIHQAVFYFLGVICFHLPVIGGEQFYNTSSKWINLTIGFIITILLSEVWNRVANYVMRSR